MPLTFFPGLMALVRATSAVLTRKGENRHFALFLTLRKETLGFLLLKMTLALLFPQMVFPELGVFPSTPNGYKGH